VAVFSRQICLDKVADESTFKDDGHTLLNLREKQHFSSAAAS